MRREAFTDLPPVIYEGIEYPDYVGMADGYVDAVLSGRVVENRFVVLACKRFRAMREAAERPENEFYWSPAHVVEFCAFFERLPQLEGFKKPSGLLVIEPWECWLAAGIFGFRKQITDYNVRFVREVHIDCPRKQGKSAWGAAIDLYCFLYEDEGRSQILIGASNRRQAEAAFGPIREFLVFEPDLVTTFGLKINKDEIRRPDGGAVQMLSSLARKNDGWNPHVAHIDELHSVPTALHEVMMSSVGARPNQLFLKTTTAGDIMFGPGLDARKRAARVLEGVEKAPNLFTVIYTIDPEDEKNPLRWENIVKAMPNLGVSIDPGDVRAMMEKARHDVFARGEFITKQLNVYSDAARRAISREAWAACAVPGLRLEQFAKRKCIIGCDLGQADDHTAIVLCFDDLENPDIPVFFCEHHIGADNPGLEDERLRDQFSEWRENGWLKVHDWPLVRVRAIEARILEFCGWFDVQEIVFDKAQSVDIVSSLIGAGRKAGQFAGNLVESSDPTHDIIDRATHGLLKHDGNPVLAWNVMNVTIVGDELIRPRKDKTNPHMKIDGFSAMVHANAARLGRVVPKMPDDKPPFDPNRIVRTF